jgi:hypothetical protein
MSTLITMSINLSKLDRSELYVGKTGDKYLNAQFYLKDEPDQYGHHGMITQSISKERREAGERGEILGNAKMLVFADKPQRAPSRAPVVVAPQPSLMDDLDDDDSLPF